MLLLSVSRNFFQIPSSVDIIFGNFSLWNSTISVENLIRWKSCFEIFLIDRCAGKIANRNITDRYQNILKSVSSILYWALQFPQAATSVIPWSMKYMYDLSACNRGLLKSYYCYVYFYHSNHSWSIMKDSFNSISKNLLFKHALWDNF